MSWHDRENTSSSSPTKANCDYCENEEAAKGGHFISFVSRLQRLGWTWTWHPVPDDVIHWCPGCREKLPKTVKDAHTVWKKDAPAY